MSVMGNTDLDLWAQGARRLGHTKGKSDRRRKILSGQRHFGDRKITSSDLDRHQAGSIVPMSRYSAADLQLVRAGVKTNVWTVEDMARFCRCGDAYRDVVSGCPGP